MCRGLTSEFAIDGKIVQCWRRPVARLRGGHHITHSHGAAEGDLDLHATATRVRTPQERQSSRAQPRLNPLYAYAHRPYAFMFLFPFACPRFAGRDMKALFHFDHGFNFGVVSAGATTPSVDGRGCYLRVPLVPFRSPGCTEESSLVRALIGRRPSTRSLLVHHSLVATGDDIQ